MNHITSALMGMAMARMPSPLSIPALGMQYPERRATLPTPMINNATSILNELVIQYLASQDRIPQINPLERNQPSDFIDDLVEAIGRARARNIAPMRAVYKCERGHAIAERRIWLDFQINTDNRLTGYCGSCGLDRFAEVTLEPIEEESDDDD